METVRWNGRTKPQSDDLKVGTLTETEVFKLISEKGWKLQNGNHRFEKREKTGNRNYVGTEKCLLICRNEEAEPKGEVF